ncbi:uncharacterized protein LOC122859502 isoform X1 [Aphidius gifuensis]|uniref:uncharacterized protein LOC122859502 isoform X1 n=1 Tax=Aphidius gifuensis TaxID=684658 RepID=UPI001CDCAAD0|nr:uncharacterized protein LOC122859502 isoform X1 [Aphidius gifuensis]
MKTKYNRICVMKRRSIHQWAIVVILTLACINDSSLEIEAIKLNKTFPNETKVNKFQQIANDTTDEISENFMLDNNNLHEMDNNKPSKLDLDVSEVVYMDSKNSTDIGSRIDSSIEWKSFCSNSVSINCIQRNVSTFIKDLSETEPLNMSDTVLIAKNNTETTKSTVENLFDGVHKFAKNYRMMIDLDKFSLNLQESRTFFGGFGLGFLAFGLKKLFLPIMIGVQVVKTMLFALFLPSIIGSIGKFVGKGVSSFAQTSQSVTAQPEETFEFKDNSDLYGDDYMTKQPLGTLPAPPMYDETMIVQPSVKPDSRLAYVNSRFSNPIFNDRYYTRHQIEKQGSSKKQDFKVFHDIPTSSLLLTNYDPFYSPLLSRLDAVFSRLGHTTEGCREYAVCAMYRSPARFAPYSNLVSAQLSRELNELRRPSSDNPDVLRFFRYMKAAKDGQDGIHCEEAFSQCDVPRDDPSLQQNQAMLATYQDIDKLVHARKI